MKNCFVIAPIGDPGSPTRLRSDRVLKELIRPAVNDCGYFATRADEIDSPGMITTHMVQRLLEDPLVVADLSDHNPNVFYELGIRHSVGKPLVQLIETGQRIPFDVAGMRVIQISLHDENAIHQAMQQIIGQVHVLEKDSTILQTPVSVAMAHPGLKHDLPDRFQGVISGKRLFQYHGYYPIDLAPETNIPSLNPDTYLKAVKYFLKKDHYDKLAAIDLVFLREDNLVDSGDILKTNVGLDLYSALVQTYDLHEFTGNFAGIKEGIFRNYKRLVDDLGDTLKGVYFEILLHNVMNPLRSIIAARNSEQVSRRRLYDPSTRFVVQFVKNQGRKLILAMEGGSKVSYLKQFNRTKQVKATTTPIYHPRYRLIGIVCANIDIDAVKSLDEQGQRTFFENYMSNSGHTPDFEKKT